LGLYADPWFSLGIAMGLRTDQCHPGSLPSKLRAPPPDWAARVNVDTVFVDEYSATVKVGLLGVYVWRRSFHADPELVR
jgi:hypothetical protein